MNQKQARQEAQRYHWHLLPPWRERFDHDHWWLKPGQQVPLEAGIWEIFRRHPDMPSHIHRITASTETQILMSNQPAPILVAGYCFRSWPKLEKRHRKLWREFLEEVMPPQRGFHPGSVIVLNDYRKKAISLRSEAKGDPAKVLNCVRFLSFVDTYQDQMTADVVEHDKKGRILIAVDPLATGTGKLVEQIVKDWRKEKSAVKRGKPRLGQWGDVIYSFETRELSGQKRSAQLFARYRRIIGALKLSR